MGTWKALKDKHFSPEEQAAIREEAVAMGLPALRATRRLSQEELGKALGMKQASVSKLERQADMFVSSLRNLIQAMGGEMKIVASFPEGEVLINQFSELIDHQTEAEARPAGARKKPATA